MTAEHCLHREQTRLDVGVYVNSDRQIQGEEAAGEILQIRNPEPETRKSKLETQNPAPCQPRSTNPRRRTIRRDSLNPQTSNIHPGTPNHNLETRNPKPPSPPAAPAQIST